MSRHVLLLTDLGCPVLPPWTPEPVAIALAADPQVLEAATGTAADQLRTLEALRRQRRQEARELAARASEDGISVGELPLMPGRDLLAGYAEVAETPGPLGVLATVRAVELLLDLGGDVLDPEAAAHLLAGRDELPLATLAGWLAPAVGAPEVAQIRATLDRLGTLPAAAALHFALDEIPGALAGDPLGVDHAQQALYVPWMHDSLLGAAATERWARGCLGEEPDQDAARRCAVLHPEAAATLARIASYYEPVDGQSAPEGEVAVTDLPSDPAAFDRVWRKIAPHTWPCLQEAGPAASVRVVWHLASGRVTQLTLEGDPAISACVAPILRDIRFNPEIYGAYTTLLVRLPLP